MSNAKNIELGEPPQSDENMLKDKLGLRPITRDQLRKELDTNRPFGVFAQGIFSKEPDTSLIAFAPVGLPEEGTFEINEVGGADYVIETKSGEIQRHDCGLTTFFINIDAMNEFIAEKKAKEQANENRIKLFDQIVGMF